MNEPIRNRDWSKWIVKLEVGAIIAWVIHGDRHLHGAALLSGPNARTVSTSTGRSPWPTQLVSDRPRWPDALPE